MANNPKQIWQDQPTEPSTMTLEKIKQKVRELNAKTRQELIKAIASPVLVVVISCLAFAMMHDNAQRWILAVALAWSLAGQRALHRGMRLATLPGDAAMTTALDYYRREVERRRALYRRGLLWSFGPIVLALAAYCLPFARNPKQLANALPFLILVAVWIVGFFIFRIRLQRDLRREIDELITLERTNV
jgi:lipopolysaccharide export LptBFGC system permease protein LptF